MEDPDISAALEELAHQGLVDELGGKVYRMSSELLRMWVGRNHTVLAAARPSRRYRQLREEPTGGLRDRRVDWASLLLWLAAGALAARGVVKAAALGQHAGRQVRVAGLLITAKVVHTRRGEPMEFVTFEDRTGLFETVVFAREYAKVKKLLLYDKPLVVKGKAEEDSRLHAKSGDGRSSE